MPSGKHWALCIRQELKKKKRVKTERGVAVNSSGRTRPVEDTTRTIQDVALCDSLFDSIRFGTDRQTGRRAPRGKEETEQRADESCLFLSTSKAEAAAEAAGDQKWIVSDQNKRATSQNQHSRSCPVLPCPFTSLQLRYQNTAAAAALRSQKNPH